MISCQGFVRVGVGDNIRPAGLLGREEQIVHEVGDKGNLVLAQFYLNSYFVLLNLLPFYSEHRTSQNGLC